MARSTAASSTFDDAGSIFVPSENGGQKPLVFGH
jgi:hypothetical protein